MRSNKLADDLMIFGFSSSLFLRSRPITSKTRIYSALVVEDDPAMLELLETLLSDMEIFKTIIKSKDGSDAFQKGSRQIFDIIITDLSLPKRTGEILIADLFRVHKNHPLKFMVISGELNPERIEELKRAKVQCILAKPFSNDDLMQKVKQVVMGVPKDSKSEKNHKESKGPKETAPNTNYKAFNGNDLLNSGPGDSYQGDLEALKKLNILVVDDIPIMRNLVHRMLLQEGFSNVILAENGQVAYELIVNAFKDHKPFELIISDWNMPELNGVMLLKMMRKEPHFEKLPFILISLESEQENIQKMLELGANDYLTKPFPSEVLIQKIKQLVK